MAKKDWKKISNTLFANKKSRQIIQLQKMGSGVSFRLSSAKGQILYDKKLKNIVQATKYAKVFMTNN